MYVFFHFLVIWIILKVMAQRTFSPQNSYPLMSDFAMLTAQRLLVGNNFIVRHHVILKKLMGAGAVGEKVLAIK